VHVTHYFKFPSKLHRAQLVFAEKVFLAMVVQLFVLQIVPQIGSFRVQLFVLQIDGSFRVRLFVL